MEPGAEFLIKGMEQFKEGNYEKALEELQKAEIYLPEDPDIPFFIGLAYLYIVRPEDAVPYLQSTIEKDPMYWDAYFQLGTALCTLERFEEALDPLEKVYKVQPQREDLGCLLGMACYRVGRYEEALKYLETGVSSDRMRDVVAMYTGLAREKVGKRKESRLGFSDLYTLDPTSVLAEPARRLFDVLRMEEVVVRPYRFSATFRAMYDDNVRLIPTENVFGVGHPKPSFGQSVFLKGEYSLLKRPKYEINANYGFYQTIYNSDRKFDVQDHIPGLSFIYRGEIGPIGISPRLDYSFDYVLLDYRWFQSRHTARPSLTLTEGPHFMTLLSFTFEGKDYSTRPDFRADNRDGVNYNAGLTQFLRTADGKHYIKFGYYRDWERTIGDNWDYDANQLLGGAQVTLPKRVQLSADYSWERRRHRNDNIFFGKHRKDTERVISASLSRDFGDHITVFGEYLRRRSSSNLALFDYEKNIYSLGISYRY
ncbi:MAG: tetratricopeptide repeat protein [Candidatus Brocadiaceae bacterium]|nr:tetratricopeptide repeat protein [Candidatus Brocadiaceae bacterium]